MYLKQITEKTNKYQKRLTNNFQRAAHVFLKTIQSWPGKCPLQTQCLINWNTETYENGTGEKPYFTYIKKFYEKRCNIQFENFKSPIPT